MASASERQTANESRAATTDVATDNDSSADAAASDHDTSGEKPANGIPAWLADGYAVGGPAAPRKEGWLEWLFRSG